MLRLFYIILNKYETTLYHSEDLLKTMRQEIDSSKGYGLVKVCSDNNCSEEPARTLE